MTDVVGLYLNPPDKALVLCVDEKSQIAGRDRAAALTSGGSPSAGDDDDGRVKFQIEGGPAPKVRV
jgi:hypothetical protein